jgi:hypothetical protein
VPATPSGDDSRDDWTRGSSARHGHGGGYRDGEPPRYGEPPRRRPEPPPGPAGYPSGDGPPDPRFTDGPPDPRFTEGPPDPRFTDGPPDLRPGGAPRHPGYDRPGAYEPPTGYERPGGYGEPTAFDEPTALTPLIRPADAPALAQRPDAPIGTAGPEPDGPAAPETPIRRSVSLATAGLVALLTLGLVFGAMITHGSYGVVIFGVQVLFVLAWTVASGPPAPRVVAATGLAAAAGADLAALWAEPASLAPLAYVTAGAFVAGVIGQLTRSAGRVRVTESLGSTLVVVVGVVAFATLVVLSRQPRGTQAIVACLAAAGVAVAVARLVDTVFPYPRLAPQVPRGGAGVVLGAMVGAVVAALAGALLDGLTVGPAAAAGLVTALVAVIVDLSAGYADAGRQLAGEPPALSLARHIQGPLAAFALAAPAAYAASLLLLLDIL